MTKKDEKIIAFEVANSYVKTYDGKKTEAYLNTLKRAPKLILNKDSVGDIYEVLGEKFLIAKSSKYESTNSRSEERYNNINFKREALISIARLVKNGDVITAVTGLPAIHYNDSNIERLENLLEGDHEVTINDKKIEFKIQKLHVVLQPLGTWFLQLINNKGVHAGNIDELLEGEALILDIGFESTDIAEISEGNLMEFFEGGTAMSAIYEDVISELKLKYPD